MPRFYFHIRAGTYVPDDAGTECVSLDHALTQAVQTAGETIKFLDATRWNPARGWRMVVEDKDGAEQFTLHFYVRKPRLAAPLV
jgi:hypothetical protein